MAQILVTQKGSEVMARSDSTIYLPRLEDWILVDADERKKTGEGSLWNPNMEASFNDFKKGKDVDLAGGYQIRMGWSVALLTSKGPVFVEFDSGHKLNPYKQTPPAGIWESGKPHEAALAELGEEIIIKNGDNVGFWYHDGSLLSEDWVKEYADHHGCRVEKKLLIPISYLLDYAPQVQRVQFVFGANNGYSITGLAAVEGESGSLEGIIPFRVVGEDALKGVELVDGERLPNGTYLNRRVIYGNYTTKAKEVIKAFCL